MIKLITTLIEKGVNKNEKKKVGGGGGGRDKMDRERERGRRMMLIFDLGVGSRGQGLASGPLWQSSGASGVPELTGESSRQEWL